MTSEPQDTSKRTVAPQINPQVGRAIAKKKAADRAGTVPGEKLATNSRGEVEFRPDRMHLVAALIIVGVMLLVVGQYPLKLFWLFIFPALFIYYVLTAGTFVSPEGIRVKNAFRSGTTIAWDELQGVGFKGSKALAETKDGTSVALPAVSFNSLPRLSQASGGRIPDALTEALASMEDKVRIVHQDGRQILVDREEYEAQQARQADQARKAEQKENEQ